MWRQFLFLAGGLAILVATSEQRSFGDEWLESPVVADDQTLLEPVAVKDLVKEDKGCGAEQKVACDCCDPLWTVYAGAIYMKKESNSVFQDYDFEWGVEADIRRRLGECHELQVRYFGVDDWSDQVTIGNQFFGAGRLDSSSLHSTEVNLRRSLLSDRLSVLAGFRWVELHEELTSVVYAFGVPTVYDADTDNHMYGFQLGADGVLFDRGGRLTINSSVKAGIYHNSADALASLDINPGGFPPAISGTTQKDHTAFLGELDIVGRFCLTDHWSIRGGYQMLWLEGVAEAEGQVVGVITDDLDTSGSPFYHGAMLGIEFTR